MTSRGHFAFVNMPAVGHVNPTLALVAELVRRGHRVTYAVGPKLVPAAARAGAEPLVLPTEIRLPQQSGGIVESLLRFYVEDARECLPQLVAHFESDPPEVVCYGRVQLLLGERDILIEAGEAAEFATMTPHAVCAINEPAELIMIFDGDGQRAHIHHESAIRSRKKHRQNKQ